MPHVKSLNQVAVDRKGSANVGNTLAAWGLEDWARSYAQDSYYQRIDLQSCCLGFPLTPADSKLAISLRKATEA